MKVKILKLWHAASGVPVGGVADVKAELARHGLETGLCEEVAGTGASGKKPEETKTENSQEGKKK